ncbi:MFS transporter [Legionella waltersii]|uniref:Major facilitator superfamily transporter n=1 Tax=Legionella waltersii TaxID=66969 RepID=A0A0W1ANX4_9GAMM|nr:MFS transporter [Legionella waltersii]KTD83049.1 major facilitator superfamily transporter [Legionella waltersii]SNU97517.1 major facilitator superfamily transporter [Legionella waltersii]
MIKSEPKLQTRLPFTTLWLLISFASVNAVLFTPALPNIAHFFAIGEDTAQQTITWFLIGYALGQLVYGPLANRFGRKPALYVGVGLQIVSSLLCVFAGTIHEFWLLVLARFMLALGSGVGLKMTFTLVNECYEPKIASQKIAYLMLAFAITPGLGVAIGGVLNTYYGWTSCFYAGAIYGLGLMFLVARLPETQISIDLDALQLKHLLHGYSRQFKNGQLVTGGLLMGLSTCFVYVFAAIAPFLAITVCGLNSTEYGMASILPPTGLVLGSIVGATLSKKYSLESIILAGIWIASLGILFMFITMHMAVSILFSLFLPMIVIYFGLCFIMANASSIAMSQINDKAHGSAVMNFINVGLATFVVLGIGVFPMKMFLLPGIFIVLAITMVGVFICGVKMTTNLQAIDAD